MSNYIVGICDLYLKNNYLVTVQANSYTEAMLIAVQIQKFNLNLEKLIPSILKKCTTIEQLQEYLTQYWSISITAPQKIS